jgi:uncharacterized membrane protein YkvA (DUF1232 family)
MEAEEIYAKIDEVKSELNTSVTKAERFLLDKSDLEVIAKEAYDKGLRARNVISSAWDYLQQFCSIAKDYATGKSVDIPKGDLKLIIAGLLYFVSAADVVPDFIPLFGLVDDLFVIGLIASRTKASLDKYGK